MRLLERNGFMLDHVVGSHHVYIKEAKRVTVPLHNHDLPKGTLLEILKQAGIPRDAI